MSGYKETKFSNGLTVVSDHMSSVESASVGVYVRSGSRSEVPLNNGVAHFLEHMAFKGTERRTAEEIAREIEDVGGNMNAYTSRETTAYHLKMLKEDLPLAVDILGDILLNSTFEQQELERERGVILQELGETLDTPDDVVFENLQEVMYPNQPLGRSILGTEETIKAMSREQLQHFMSENYTASNMVISAAGHVDHDALVGLVEEHFANVNTVTAPEIEKGVYQAGAHIQQKELEQVHLALSWEGVNAHAPEYYDASVWTAVVGGGMASRLFQEVREKRGLAYSIFGYMSQYKDTGSFGVYAGTARKDVPELLQVLQTELAKAGESITDEELRRAKAQISAGVRMSQESTDARMGRMARDMFIEKRHVPLSEILQKVDAVTVDSACLAGRNMTVVEKRALSALGNVEDLNF